MRKAILAFWLALAVTAPAFCQEVGIPDQPAAQIPAGDIVPFGVAVDELTVWVSPAATQLAANGTIYLVAENPPKAVAAVIIVTEGDHQPWIVVRKVMGGRSRKLKPFEPNSFLYEHEGPGEYEVTSQDEAKEPVFSYFDVEGDEPPPPPPPPPPGDFVELVRIVQANKPADAAACKKLGDAWIVAIDATFPDVTAARKQIGIVRGNVLSDIRNHDGSWNKFLVAVDAWFAARPDMTLSAYLAAMKAAATELGK